MNQHQSSRHHPHHLPRCPSQAPPLRCSQGLSLLLFRQQPNTMPEALTTCKGLVPIRWGPSICSHWKACSGNCRLFDVALSLCCTAHAQGNAQPRCLRFCGSCMHRSSIVNAHRDMNACAPLHVLRSMDSEDRCGHHDPCKGHVWQDKMK
jgi:hypothetical protein